MVDGNRITEDSYKGVMNQGPEKRAAAAIATKGATNSALRLRNKKNRKLWEFGSMIIVIQVYKDRFLPERLFYQATSSAK